MPGLRNSSDSQQKGFWAETVVQEHFCKNGYSILAHRKKLKFGEIDLILSKGCQILFVEVKYLHNPWMGFQRLTYHQKKKILLNVVFYQTLNPKYEIKPLLCLVDVERKITHIEL